MKRPELTKIKLEEAEQNLFSGSSPSVTITMSEGQWDAFLCAAYDGGSILLELDSNEMPVAAYQKTTKQPD